MNPQPRLYPIPDIGMVEWSADSTNDSVPEIPAGEIYILNLRGEPINETRELRPFLPFLNAVVSNQSAQNIRVQIGQQRRSGFTVGPRRARALSGIPFTELTIFNLGADTINANEITLVCSNDTDSILKYTKAVDEGLIAPLIFRR